MNELKVTFYLKKNEERVDGTMPILGRIRIGKSMVQFSTKVYAIPSLWDVKSGRTVGRSKPAAATNKELDRISLDIHSACKDLLAKKENVSALEVKNAFQGISSEQETLISHYEKCNDSFYKKVGINRKLETYKQYCVALNHLKDFLRQKYNVRDLPFQSLNPAFVSAYDLYLRSDLKIGRSTVTRMMGYLHRVLKSAINSGYLRQDPFIGYTFDYVPIVPKFLSEKELKRMITTPLPKSNLNLVRDVFLFSAFTGISFSDLRDKYRGIAKADRLFPMYSCSKTNIYLKRIAEICGIKRRVTFHQARHTYASVITLSQGVPLDTVRELMGHRDWRATRIYAHLTYDKVNEDMGKLQKRITDKFRLAEEEQAETVIRKDVKRNKRMKP